MHLNYNIQLDTKTDTLAKEPGWCVSLHAPQMDMWTHTDTVVITLDAHQMGMLKHCDSVKIIITGTVSILMLLLSLLLISLHSTTSYNCK